MKRIKSIILSLFEVIVNLMNNICKTNNYLSVFFLFFRGKVTLMFVLFVIYFR